ncbi:hypothetical protein A2U01_0012544 [Trifolium medium]|uniref:Uncharacterized protein n=1 Tax=Trifolium medium TaxID=97028 RepID=A0A392MVQ4_9FABA|nr:hypothetical protein [Trifolium medium]
MSGELFPQIFPRSDGLRGQVLVPDHGSLLQYPHDVAGKGTARRVLVTLDWGMRRGVVMLRRHRATIFSVSTVPVA